MQKPKCHQQCKNMLIEKNKKLQKNQKLNTHSSLKLVLKLQEKCCKKRLKDSKEIWRKRKDKKHKLSHVPQNLSKEKVNYLIDRL